MNKLQDSFNRIIVPSGIRKEGHSNNLAVDQLAVVKSDKVTTKGYSIVEDFRALRKDQLIQIKMGTMPKSKLGKGESNLDLSTVKFTTSDIFDMRCDSVVNQKLKGDIILGGYNGTKGTGIKLDKNSVTRIGVKLKGDALLRAGLKNDFLLVTTELFSPRVLPNVDNNINKVTSATLLEPRELGEILEIAVKTLNNKPIKNGFKFKDFAKASVINSKHKKVSTEELKVYNIDIPFISGSSQDLADVQMQYPEHEVRLNEKRALDEFWSFVLLGKTKPTAYKMTVGQGESVFCGCEDDDAEIAGFQYTLIGTIEDLETILGEGTMVEGSLKDLGTNTSGDKVSSFVSTKILDESVYKTLATTEGYINLSTEKEIIKVCTKGTQEVSFNWEEVGTLFAKQDKYTIRLADIDCGTGSRLDELQAAYGELKITEVAGTDSVCMRTYETTVLSDFVSDNCSPLIYDVFESEGPRSYQEVPWMRVKEEVDYTDAEFGIQIEGLTFKATSDVDELRDMPNFQDFMSVDLWISDDDRKYKFAENYNTNLPLKRAYLQRGSKVYGLGIESLGFEIESQNYFRGEHYSSEYPLKNALQGLEHKIQPNTAYVSYFLGITKGQGYNQQNRSARSITYEFMFPVGEHRDFEEYFNGLAAVAGFDTMKALSDK